MRKLANGWTVEKIREQVKKYNNGTRAITLPEVCSYFTGNNRCFIGCFIPDGHEALYAQKGVEKLLDRCKDLQPFMPFNKLEDLKDFQMCHDNSNVEFKGDTYKALEDFLQDCE